MLNNKWWLLQLFAGEGSGGSGAAAGGEGGAAATGENSADAGQQRLREMGVPEDKIRKNRAYRTAPKQTEAKPAEESQEQMEQAAAAQEEPPAEGKTSRMTWEEIIKDPEYNRQIQSVIQSRIRKSSAAQEAMDTMGPALEALLKKHGLDPQKPDYKALSQKILDDDSLYEDKAYELNVPKDVAKTLVRQEMDLQRYQRQEQLNMEQRRNVEHFRSLEQQAQALKAKYPAFDLRTELLNPVFERMTRPNSGVSVEDAYYAVHRKDIQQAQAQVIAEQTAKQISNAVRSNARRPDESGSAQAPSVTHFDYKNATKAERNALKASIYAAAARGEKIYPGR